MLNRSIVTKPRPETRSVAYTLADQAALDRKKFEENWDAIFKKKPVKTYAGGKPNRVLDSADYDFNEKDGTFTLKEGK